jgi:glycosyltransferase involved in cell wall biosynthesis
MANSLTCPIWRIIGVRTVVSLDGMEWKRSSYGWLTRVVVRASYLTAIVFSNALTVDNKVLLSWVRDKTSHPAVLVGYGPREFEVASPEELSSFLYGFGLKEKGYFLFVGRLVPEKGVHVLVRAFASHPSETLVVVGADPFGGGYEQMLKVMAPPNVVFLGGHYGRAYELLNIAALAQIRPSIDDSEGLPPAAIEAMGFGLAIIASDVAQNREAFGNAAIYYDTKSIDSLHCAINEIGRNAQLRRKLGELASSRASIDFSWDIWISVLDHVYATLDKDYDGE